MPPSTPPTVRLRKLTSSLKKHRNGAGLSVTAAAQQLGFSQPKMSRIESGAVRPKLGDVAAMLELYGVQSPERDALLNLAREADRRGWWTPYDDLFSGSFLALEDEAEQIKLWEGQLIPGLFQTEDYAREIIGSVHPDDPEGTHRRVIARMNRGMLLRRPDPPRVHAVIGEAVVRQQIGGEKVMRAQITALWEMAARPNVELQIVPFTANAHPGLEGPLALFSFAEDSDLDVAHIEGPGGPVYLEGADVKRIRVGFETIVRAAMSPKETRDFLAGLTS